MQMEMFQSPAVVVNGEVETWKEVPGFIRYEVSTMGRFRRKSTLKAVGGSLSHNGYLHIGLTRDGKQVFKLAHRLVAEAFLEKPSPLHNDVNHKNKKRADNRAYNLEWLTRSENSKHAKRKP